MYSAGGNKLATEANACALFWFLVGARIASEQIWPETGPEATSTPTCAALRCKRITTDAIRNRANQPGFLFWGINFRCAEVWPGPGGDKRSPGDGASQRWSRR